MRVPDRSQIERLGTVESTQLEMAARLQSGSPTRIVTATEQSAGKGRLGRIWHTAPGESLAASIAFPEYADHPRAYLIAMGAAIAAAGVLHAQVRWPNDVVLGVQKVGGILTEMLPDADGRRVPVVGIGLNLNQETFPEEIAEIATSVRLVHGTVHEPEAVLKAILDRLERLPEPQEWSDFAPIWALFDRTPGKMYKLPTGELATAIGVGGDAQLLCHVDGESRAVMAAEALFPPG